MSVTEALQILVMAWMAPYASHMYEHAVLISFHFLIGIIVYYEHQIQNVTVFQPKQKKIKEWGLQSSVPGAVLLKKKKEK